MAVFEVYSHPVVVRYRASICTKTTIFMFIVFGLTLVVPFLVAYTSEGFWVKQSVYLEQPYVSYKHQLLMVLEGTTATEYLVWSTYHNYNMLEQQRLRIPIVKSREEDTNRDGKPDKLLINIETPMLDTEQVYSLHLLVIFEYQLFRFSSLTMESMAYIHYNSPRPGAMFTVDGELQFKQNYPLPHRGIVDTYNYPVINGDSIYAADYQLTNIFRDYMDRNESTTFVSAYPVWVSGKGAGKPFIIQATIRYPEETILYYPGFWQLIKLAWIQYLAVLLIFIFIFGRLKTFVFQNHILQAAIERPFKLRSE
ncbi:transmembrane protein 231-like [Saccoglossus kowalevskii]|uniref:Transmembrane protein 231 n=1 Tax=Saccoglossus kowalevskii TaxID=10224 RepID=A0ABM0MUE9_SACKO|nr:PREDICTED: transmembrane protein 231-like [Saccoglossus kowalevskii]